MSGAAAGRDAVAELEKIDAILARKFPQDCYRGARGVAWLDERLDGALEELAETDAEVQRLKAPRSVLRCASCDHDTTMHQEDGCWFAVSTGRTGHNVVCACAVSRSVLLGTPAEG